MSCWPMFSSGRLIVAGGDGRGSLLAAQNFNDGRCYQINSRNISIARQQEFPNPVQGQISSVYE